MQPQDRYSYDIEGNLIAARDRRGRLTTYRYDGEGRLTAALYPGGASQRFVYDRHGRLVRRIKRDGRAVTYAYDGAGRLAAVRYGPGDEVRYRYDDQDRLVEALVPGCRTRYRYDAGGRVVQEERAIDGRSYVTRYRYDKGGRLSALRAPGSRRWLRYAYDSMGRLVRLGLAGHRADIRLSYDGPSLDVAYPNGLHARHEMDDPLTMRRITLAPSGPQSGGEEPALDLNYHADERGFIVQVNRERYRYDGRDRCVAYVDAAGRETRYGYDAEGTRRGPAGRVRCKHDGNGNLVSKVQAGVRWAYEHDARDRLVVVRRDGQVVAGYAYDHRDRRVLKRTPAGTTVYHYDLFGFCLGESREGKLACLNLGTPANLLGRVYLADPQSGERIEYFHHDHLASVRAVSDEQGRLRARLDYDPFGALRGPLPADCTPVFAGKTMDAESGLYYFGARYYDPEMGRFLSPDTFTYGPDDERLCAPRPAGDTPLDWQDLLSSWGQGPGPEVEEGESEEQASRRRQLKAWQEAGLEYEPYAYARNNPLAYVDLDGHQAGWYFLYTLLALVWSIPYTVGAFVSWEFWFNWICYTLISFAWAWDRDSSDRWPYRWEGHSSDRLGAWGWFINGGLAGKMVMGAAFTQGNIVIGKWDEVMSFDDTVANIGVPSAPDLGALTTERQGVYVHELRHVNQFAWWGPFMMPWVLLAYYLANLIFVSAAIGLGTPFSATARETFLDLWRAQWTILREGWIPLLVSIPFLPGAYWWDYMCRGGYGQCWFEQDAYRHSGMGYMIETIITAQEESLSTGGTTLVTVAYNPNMVAGGYTQANAQGVPTPTINPNTSGATIAPEATFEAAVNAGTMVNMRVFEYTAGATAGTDTLRVTYAGNEDTVEITVE